MANPSKRKGSRVERELKAKFEKMGLVAHRTPMSGAIVGFDGDVRVRINGKDFAVECKARKDGAGFKTLERWLAQSRSDFLVLRKDRGEFMAVIPFPMLAHMLVRDDDG